MYLTEEQFWILLIKKYRNRHGVRSDPTPVRSHRSSINVMSPVPPMRGSPRLPTLPQSPKSSLRMSPKTLPPSPKSSLSSLAPSLPPSPRSRTQLPPSPRSRTQLPPSPRSSLSSLAPSLPPSPRSRTQLPPSPRSSLSSLAPSLPPSPRSRSQLPPSPRGNLSSKSGLPTLKKSVSYNLPSSPVRTQKTLPSLSSLTAL